MLILELSRKPPYKQIIEQIQKKIETRVLRPGEELPSSRRLAKSLGIHRSTVANAYKILSELGFVDLRPGACPRVCDRMDCHDDNCKRGLITSSLTTKKAHL